jgi:hypothetical protein
VGSGKAGSAAAIVTGSVGSAMSCASTGAITEAGVWTGHANASRSTAIVARSARPTLAATSAAAVAA